MYHSHHTAYTLTSHLEQNVELGERRAGVQIHSDPGRFFFQWGQMSPVLSFDFVRSGDTDGSLLWSVQVELARKRKTYILQAHQTGRKAFICTLCNNWYIKYKWWWWWWQWQWLHDDDHIDHDDDGDVCGGNDNDGRIVTSNADCYINIMKYQVSFCVKTWHLHMWKYHHCYGFLINRTF